MKPEKFTDYLEAPGKIDAEGLSAFSEIISEYPFCQPAQLLYLKGLQNDGNIRFNRQLKITAAYANNRRGLFELLNVSKTEVGEKAEEVIHFVSESSEVPEERAGLVQQVEDFLPIADLDLLLFDFPAYREDNLPDVPFETLAPDFVVEKGPENELMQQFLEMDPLSRKRVPKPEVRSMHVQFRQPSRQRIHSRFRLPEICPAHVDRRPRRRRAPRNPILKRAKGSTITKTSYKKTWQSPPPHTADH